ncbi:hypothetical protein EVAR_15983_1 [Eumeta japonica]|uniref:Uncharacterized protein n=1 Tax=Eumeta variegata TaxID=151549 RepID=A0A4C1UM12_EUMVA|nr:hypothetical protein EVAR_15983_1 [Eumeta japonica]
MVVSAHTDRYVNKLAKGMVVWELGVPRAVKDTSNPSTTPSVEGVGFDLASSCLVVVCRYSCFKFNHKEVSIGICSSIELLGASASPAVRCGRPMAFISDVIDNDAEWIIPVRSASDLHEGLVVVTSPTYRIEPEFRH